MDSSISSAGATENAIIDQRIYEKKKVAVAGDFLKFFKDELFCDVALNTDDGKR